MGRDYCKGILLRVIVPTHVLDDSCAYDVTRLVAPYEGRVNWMEYMIKYM